MDNNQLIPIINKDNGDIAVSGRMLHEFLEVKTPYKKWFERMAEYGFEENVDYIAYSTQEGFGQKCPKLKSDNIGGRPATDHVLTLDMAKELSMIQRTERGKQARQYFIAVEKEYNSPEKVMARALLLANKELETLRLENRKQEQIIGELEPKASYYDVVLSSQNAVPITVIAKDYGWSGKRMNTYLQEKGIQFKMGGAWLLYDQYARLGYTKSETTSYVNSKGLKCSTFLTKWTQKGRLFLYETLKRDGILPLVELCPDVEVNL
ncbi:phage antirepressor KilAC domain-containing protein [Peptococcus simiae]|uniref:phage antirepressor KilAC domain-containing protein n=1 Tax=Peptococcus simiae TaxID=1643805 RepID=UPI00397F9989